MKNVRESKEFLVESLDMSRYVTSIAAALTVTLVLAICGGLGLLATWLLRLVGVSSPNEWVAGIGLLLGVLVLAGIINFLNRTLLNKLSERIPEGSDPIPSITPGSAASTLNASGSVIYAANSGEICPIEGIYVELVNPENRILLRTGETFPPVVGDFGFLRKTTWLLLEYPNTPPSQEDLDSEKD